MSTAINENNVLHAIYGGKTFLKVKVAPEIEKINIDFVEKGNAKEGKIQLYMDMIEFGSDLIRLIRTGRFEKSLLAEKQKAAQESDKSHLDISFPPVQLSVFLPIKIFQTVLF